MFYNKYKRVCKKYNINSPKQLEKSLERLSCLEMNQMRERVHERALHCLEICNEYEKRNWQKDIEEEDVDPSGFEH